VPALEKFSAAAQLEALDPDITIVDTREAATFKSGHLKNAINIMDGEKFETWLGALIPPNTSFYLAAADEESLQRLVRRTASIGYEAFIKAAFVLDYGTESSAKLDFENFKQSPSKYTIVDIRNTAETKAEPVFEDAINIPLPELPARISEIPQDKPIVVHCAAGYRSAAGSSILEDKLDIKVFDLGDRIKSFMK
jgi:hydroxyacylglutathione hydrolase